MTTFPTIAAHVDATGSSVQENVVGPDDDEDDDEDGKVAILAAPEEP